MISDPEDVDYAALEFDVEQHIVGNPLAWPFSASWRIYPVG
jgi:hypothetical protein